MSASSDAAAGTALPFRFHDATSAPTAHHPDPDAHIDQARRQQVRSRPHRMDASREDVVIQNNDADCEEADK